MFFPCTFKEWSWVSYKRATQFLIIFMRFRLHSLVSISFLVHLWYAFSFFFYLHFFNDVCFQYCRVIASFVFSERSDFSCFGSPILSENYIFPFFIISMVHFSLPNVILIFLLYIFIVCIRFSNSFSFLANSLMSFTYIRRLIIPYDLVKL